MPESNATGTVENARCSTILVRYQDASRHRYYKRPAPGRSPTYRQCEHVGPHDVHEA